MKAWKLTVTRRAGREDFFYFATSANVQQLMAPLEKLALQSKIHGFALEMAEVDSLRLLDNPRMTRNDFVKQTIGK